ncbi:MAG: phosphoribosyltransferase family protein [Microthrixaceae bacterium]
MLLPRRCPLCLRPGPAPCDRCAAGVPRAVPAPAPPGCDDALALFAYVGEGRRLITSLKFGNHRDGVPRLGAALAATVPGRPDVVTWVPTTAHRRRERGFDHAEVLARAVARRLGCPARRLLRRCDEGHQTGRNRAERRVGPSLAPRHRCPSTVLVVDDVWTTGSSLSAAADALRSVGAQIVLARTLAMTPPPATVGREESIAESAGPGSPPYGGQACRLG